MTKMAEHPTSRSSPSRATVPEAGSGSRAKAYFEASEGGALAARAGVTSQVVRWNLAPLATRAGSIAGILVAWLAGNEPGPGHIEVLISLESDALEVCARDQGTVLPGPDNYDQLAGALSQHGMLSFGVSPGPRSGRMLCGSIALSCPWRAVYIWRVAAEERHPACSSDGWPTLGQAEQAIARMLRTTQPDGVVLVSAHVEGPDGDHIRLHGEAEV